MNTKQTAVDFLEEQILLTSPKVYKLMKENNDFNQAKEIFEQQIKDALHYFGIENAEQYYKETYEQ
jgi:hypothetical protein